MVQVGAGVEDGDLGALAVVPGGPGGGGSDLLRGPLQVRPDLAVQPQLLQSARHGARAGVRTGDVGPEGGGLLLVGGEGDGADGTEDEGAVGAAGRGRGAAGHVHGSVVDRDERQLLGVRVVVALPDEAGDVEQLGVDRAGGEGPHRAFGVDVQVLAGLPGLHERLRAVRAGHRGGGGAAGRVGGDQDPVAGDQGHRDRGGGLLSGGLASDERSLPRSGRSVGRLRGRRADGGDGQDGRGGRPECRTRYRTHRSPQVNSGQLLRCTTKAPRKWPLAGGCWCCGGVTLAEWRQVRR